ncbi:tetratricopeptide repeat protein [Rhizobium sp. S95]|uniref:Ancillary SecYEG translocon subunit n=1 Tax=Ciceribacter sichuanensis TaxID=2949647 RepID=A0AAJ1F7B6_9HYPH|nr:MULTISPECIES: tetratricopeptide repeat protein [unclassified Ciceribacter]MCM2398805.1 tetratricopeptide repeat protein [Ciceribacter sp. S95]MCO5956989.1 tetratricopeptide repeat protein [Ciceribacter sp. S101]
MVDNNDSFIREVNDELRSEQVKMAWRKFAPIIIGAALLIVLGTAGYRGYEYWHSHRSSGAGDQFLAALTLANEGKNDEATAALAALEKDGYGAYAVLARMRSATVQAQKGDAAAAIAAFTDIGKDNSVPQVIRDVAHMRAAWLLIDTGTYEQVSAEVEAMATPTDAMRHSAREALGLAAYKAGDMVRAREWFEQITEDAEAPRNVANRARMLLDNITASGKAP